MKKRLIVNADDFGIHGVVNEAIYQAHTKGILTSASLMAGSDAFDEAVKMIKSLPTLGVGIHLTLVGNIKTVLPAKAVSSLTWESDVLCKDYIELIKRDIKGLINLQDVYDEWDAQINKILKAGIQITHFDSHQHMHMWPSFFKVAVELAKKYNILKIRVPNESLLFGITEGNLMRWISKNGLTLLSNKNQRYLRKHNFITNDNFRGMLYGGALYEERLIRCISHMDKRLTEIMCHPSTDNQTMEEIFHWGYHGEEELQGLLSEHVKEWIQKKDIILTSYQEIRN